MDYKDNINAIKLNHQLQQKDIPVTVKKRKVARSVEGNGGGQYVHHDAREVHVHHDHHVELPKELQLHQTVLGLAVHLGGLSKVVINREKKG